MKRKITLGSLFKVI